MDGYTLGTIVRTLLEKGFNPSALIGFLVIGWFLREGLVLMRSYASTKDAERKDLLDFIKMTQNQQGEAQHSFVTYCNNMTRILEGLAIRMENGQKTADERHVEIVDHIKVMHQKHEDIVRDIWKSRGGAA